MSAYATIEVVQAVGIASIKLSGLSRFFPNVPLDNLAADLDGCSTVEYNEGEYICRDGEYENSCGVILSGKASVGHSSQKTPGMNQVTLGEGELFGELAVLTGNPRIADIIASEPVTVLAVPGEKLLSLIDKYPGAKASFDALYRERALDANLRKIPILAGVSSKFIDELRKDIKLLSYKPGESIFKEGDDADYLYLIRYGYVKVSRKDTSTGAEKVLAYLTEGHNFGEMALVADGVQRMASASAITRCEAIGISKECFIRLMDAYPDIRESMEKVINMRIERNRQLGKDTLLSTLLNATIELGVVQSGTILVMDITRCINCNSCVKVCADLHDGHTLLTRKGAMLNNFFMIPTSCRNCVDPTCMTNCPTSSIIRDTNGEIFHKHTCVGCGNCAKLCPYGNITIVTLNKEYNESGTEPPRRRASRKRAMKCDMCRDYPVMGCVYNCPTGAAERVFPKVFFDEIGTVI